MLTNEKSNLQNLFTKGDFEESLPILKILKHSYYNFIMKVLYLLFYALFLNLKFDLRFPPTILGNPTSPYTGFYNGITFTHMNGEEASITRLSFLFNGKINPKFALKLEVGVSKYTLEDEPHTFPILMAGFKLRDDFGSATGSISLSIGIPELISPSFGLGIKYHGREFITLRGGPISGLALHYERFDLALLINLFSTNLDFLTSPSVGLSAGWRLK